ncbi:ribonuclease H-like domain-containing protein [Tanacetum coccineum]
MIKVERVWGEFQYLEFEGYGPKISKSVSEDISNEVRETPDAPLVKELVLDNNLEKKTIFPTATKIEFAHCNYHQMERVEFRNNYTRVNYNYSAKKTHPSAHRNMVPKVVLMKTGLKAVITSRPVTTAHPKTIVYSARPMPNSVVVNDVRANQVNVVKASGHPQKQDQGYVDSGCLSVSQMCDKKNSVPFTDTGCFVLSPDFKLADERSKDETSGTLKSFITEIENLVDKKVKVIRCDNGTEFKNRVISEFCAKKGIKREFSVARTP